MEAEMKRRVVVTGLGVISPIGNGIEEFWNGILENKVGIDTITRFDTTDYKAKLAAEVKNFDAKKYMDAKAAKRMELFCQYGVAAAKEAFSSAGLNMEKEDPYRIGISVGCGVGSLQAVEREYERLLEKGPGRVNPLLVPMMITNIAAGNISIQLGIKGKSLNIVTACATGTHSIGEAFRSIQYKDADVMLAGGCEAAISKIGIAGFAALNALSTSTDPKRASIPFDKERNGFIMGEGAGVVVLEELEHAQKRNAKILAEVVGYGATSDAYHITSPSEDGAGAAKAMELAMEEADVNPEEVVYINAHGTSTQLNDLFETKAIKLAFKEAASKVKISSTKSMTGHLLGAAGAVESIASILAIKNGIVPPTINHEEGDNDENIDYDLNFTFNKAQKREVNVALSNTFGFGGHNACVIFKKYAE